MAKELLWRKRYSLKLFLLFLPLVFSSIAFVYWHDLRHAIDLYWFKRDYEIHEIESLDQLNLVLAKKQKVILCIDYPFSIETRVFHHSLRNSHRIWYHSETRGYKFLILNTKTGFLGKEDQALLKALNSIPDGGSDPDFHQFKKMKAYGVAVMVSDGNKKVYDGLLSDEDLFMKIVRVRNFHQKRLGKGS